MTSKLVAALRATIRLDTAEFKKNAKGARRELRTFGRDLQGLGRSFTVGFSAPLIAAGGVALKFSTDLNRSMSNVGTLLGGVSRESTARLKELKSEVQDLARETGKSTNDLSEGLYQVISAFGDSAESSRQLGVAVRASIAGVSSTKDSLGLLSAVTKAYGDTTTEAQKKVADLAFQTVKLGETTFPELASSMGQVSSLAAELNVAQEELFATFAAGTGPLGKTSEVGTKIKGVFSSLLKPTADLEKVYKEIGVTSGQMLVQQFGLIGALDKVSKTAESMGIPLGKVIGSVEGLGLAFALQDEVGEQYRSKLEQIKDSSGAMSDAFEQQAEGINRFGFALGQLRQVAETTLQEVGDAIVDAVGDEALAAMKSFGEEIRGAVAWFNNLEESTKSSAIQFTGLAAAIGFVLVPLGGAIALLGLISAKIWIAVGVIGALGINFNNLKDVAVRSLDFIEAGVNTLSEAFPGLADAVDKAFQLIEAGSELMKQSFKQMIDSIIGGIQKVIGTTLKLAEKLDFVFPNIGESARKIAELGNSFRNNLAVIDETRERTERYKQTQQELNKVAKEYPNLLKAIKSNAKEGFGKLLSGDVSGFNTALKKFGNIDELMKSIAVSTEKADEKKDDFLGGAPNGLSDELKEAARRVEDLKDELERLESDLKLEGIQDAIDDALETGDTAALAGLMEDFRVATRDGISLGYKEAFEQGGEAAEIAQKIISEQTENRAKEMNERIADDLAEKQKRAYEEGINFWRGTFENAITGVKFDLKDMLQQVAVGFAAEVAQGLTATMGGGFSDLLSGLSSPQDLGGKLAGKLFGQVTGSIVGGGTQGIGPVASGSQYASMLGGGSFASTLMSAAPGIGAAIGVASAASFVSDVFSNPGQRYEDFGMGSAQGIAGRATTAIATGGLSELALGIFGGSGPSHPETLARKAAEDYLEEMFEDVDFNARLFNDFKGGDGVSAAESFFSTFDQGNRDDANAFLGIGKGLAEQLGIEDLDGGQLGMMLADGFGNGVDALKDLAKQAGLTFEGVKETLLELGRTGEESWLAVTSQILETAEVFEPGLHAFADMNGAMRKIIESAGFGQKAISGIVDIAVEAGEAGVTTFDGLRQHLTQSGEWTALQIEALFHAFAQNGVTSFEQIKEAGDQELGSIVAAMDAFFQDNGQNWSEMAGNFEELSKPVKELAENLDKINNREINVDLNIRQHVTGDTVTDPVASALGNMFNGGVLKKFANGGIVNAPTLFGMRGGLGLMGEAGPEGILPLGRGRHGKLGVLDHSGSRGKVVNITIHAEGAQAGVEESLYAMAENLAYQIYDRVESRA